MPTINSIVTYVISNAGTPKFLVPSILKDGAVDDARVRALAPNTPILRLTGTIRKGNATKNMGAKTLTITAAKWLNPETSIVPNVANNTISVRVPEFAKGRGNVSRAIDPTNAATKALLARVK